MSDELVNPDERDFDEHGRFRPGNRAAKRRKRISRRPMQDVLDDVSSVLAEQYKGTKAEDAFIRGFSPAVELMKMYADELNAKKSSKEFKRGVLARMLPYLYPQMKTIEFQGLAGLSPLKILLMSEDEDDHDEGKGKNGNSIPQDAE